jgi:hypothetical protein
LERGELQFKRGNSSQYVGAELFIGWQEPGCLESLDVRRTQCQLPHDMVFIWQQNQQWKPIVFSPQRGFSVVASSGFVLVTANGLPVNHLILYRKQVWPKAKFFIHSLTDSFYKCLLTTCCGPRAKACIEDKKIDISYVSVIFTFEL